MCHSDEIGSYRLRVQSEHTIPPNTLAYVEVEARALPDGSAMLPRIVGMREGREWVVPTSVIKFKGGRALAPIVNVTDNRIHFHRGQRLGRVEPLASADGEILMMEDPSEHAASPICVENVTPLGTFKVGANLSEDQRLGLQTV